MSLCNISMLLRISVCVGLVVFLAGCPASPYTYRYLVDKDIQSLIAKEPPAYPAVHFAVGSDVHLYDANLGIEGAAFEEYLANDRKMLAQSEEILDTMLDNIVALEPQFLVISGDLTKDGEAVDHALAAQYLEEVEAGGIPVYVIPGNHDINNPDAKRFDGAQSFPVDTVTPAEFRAQYEAFGFDEALYEDEDSLSYVAEPVEGLWLLCLDSTDSDGNQILGYPRVGGSFSVSTLAWIEDRLIEAATEGKAVMAVMHHGAVPHWDGQERFHPEYLVDQYLDVSQMFAAYHVRTVFTGHYHSQDVARKVFKKWGYLYDIETASFVTYPSVFREITVSGGSMKIATHQLEAIPSIPEGFVDYAEQITYEGVDGIAENTLIEDYGVPAEDAVKVAGQVASAFIAHYGGDESPAEGNLIDRAGIGFMGQIVLTVQRYVIEGLWHDTDGADLNLNIDLSTGEWTDG